MPLGDAQSCSSWYSGYLLYVSCESGRHESWVLLLWCLTFSAGTPCLPFGKFCGSAQQPHLSQGHCSSWQSSKRAHSLPALGSALPSWLGELGSLRVGGRQRLVYLGHERIKCLPCYTGTLFWLFSCPFVPRGSVSKVGGAAGRRLPVATSWQQPAQEIHALRMSEGC